MIYWVDEPYWDPPCGKQAGWELHFRNMEEMGSPTANVVHYWTTGGKRDLGLWQLTSSRSG